MPVDGRRRRGGAGVEQRVRVGAAGRRRHGAKTISPSCAPSATAASSARWPCARIAAAFEAVVLKALSNRADERFPTCTCSARRCCLRLGQGPGDVGGVLRWRPAGRSFAVACEHRLRAGRLARHHGGAGHDAGASGRPGGRHPQRRPSGVRDGQQRTDAAPGIDGPPGGVAGAGTRGRRRHLAEHGRPPGPGAGQARRARPARRKGRPERREPPGGSADARTGGPPVTTPPPPTVPTQPNPAAVAGTTEAPTRLPERERPRLRTPRTQRRPTVSRSRRRARPGPPASSRSRRAPRRGASVPPPMPARPGSSRARGTRRRHRRRSGR